MDPNNVKIMIDRQIDNSTMYPIHTYRGHTDSFPHKDIRECKLFILVQKKFF